MVLAKTWHFRNTQGICKQLNRLSLDQVCICQIAEFAMRLIVCSFHFFVRRQLKAICIGTRFLYVQYILLVDPSILFRAVKNMSSSTVHERYL
jgi:hypothetical protein